MPYLMHGPSMVPNAFLRWGEGIAASRDNGVHIARGEGLSTQDAVVLHSGSMTP